MDWVTTGINFAASIVVAVITARLTVHLAIKRFYAEKWWERRYSAYAAIIEVSVRSWPRSHV